MAKTSQLSQNEIEVLKFASTVFSVLDKHSAYFQLRDIIHFTDEGWKTALHTLRDLITEKETGII